MSKNKNRKQQSEAKSFLAETASPDSQGIDVSESESPEASADQAASEASMQESIAVSEVKQPAANDVPGKYRKFQKNA